MLTDNETIKAADTLQAMMKETFSEAYDLGITHAIAIVQEKLGLYPGLCDAIISKLNILKDKRNG